MERLGDSVRRAIAATALPDVGGLAEITRAWPAAVGDGIARAAWPARIGRDGTLYVNTVSSVWAFELAALAPDILVRLRGEIGDSVPPSVRFAPGPVPAPPAPAPPSSDDRLVVSPTEAELLRAAELAAPIEDPELRELAQRTAASSLARQRSGRAF